MEVKNVSANWKKLQAQLKDSQSLRDKSVPKTQKRKRITGNILQTSPKLDRRSKKKSEDNPTIKFPTTMIQSSSMNGELPSVNTPHTDKTKINAGLSEGVEVGKYVALDCEMVGVGAFQGGAESALARVSIVNYNGDQVYDSYVKPKEKVTDWRTPFSGILPKHMAVARTFEEVQQTVSSIIQGRILIGHSISYDLDVLLLGHPRRDIRDTARHPEYRKLVGGSSPSLKLLASELLGINIQDGEHSSIEDARACMLLFKRDQASFERENAKKYPPPRPLPPTTKGQEDRHHKRRKRKKR